MTPQTMRVGYIGAGANTRKYHIALMACRESTMMLDRGTVVVVVLDPRRR